MGRTENRARDTTARGESRRIYGALRNTTTVYQSGMPVAPVPGPRYPCGLCLPPRHAPFAALPHPALCAPTAVPRRTCLLYTSDAADERSSVDLGGRRIIKKKT